MSLKRQSSLFLLSAIVLVGCSRTVQTLSESGLTAAPAPSQAGLPASGQPSNGPGETPSSPLSPSAPSNPSSHPSPIAVGAPVIFFTDITSGPNSGGENGGGAYVTLYGNGFGATQGSSTVSVGGGVVTTIKQWGTTHLGYQMVTIQLNASSATGNVVVTVGGKTSNAVPFTVRLGNIYCVSTTGSDGGSGKFPSCWKTIVNAKNTISAGDIVYIENGVNQTGQDNYSANLVLGSACTTAAPCALIAYPGATVTLGTPTDQNRAVYFYGGSNWVVAGLTIRAQYEGIQHSGAVNIREIANDVSCPNGGGQDACIHSDSGSTYIYAYGNYVHHTGINCGSDCKEYHAFYMSTDTNHVWVGWNEIAPNPDKTAAAGCRAIQFYSTGGSDQYDLHVHDNYVHDAICDGINFATVNPDNGTVEAYNNVVAHVGTGPDPNGAEANYTCVNLGSSGTPKTSAQIYNNTFYDCGGRGASEGDAGAFSLYANANLTNNIVDLVSGEAYFSNSTVKSMACSSFTGSTNNILYGAGANAYCATTLANTKNVDPQFVSTTLPNFDLQATSPAIDAGVAESSLLFDIAGNVRPEGAGYDIGAYEY